MDNLRKRLIIIDSNSVIHRAFHALPPLTTKKGEIVGAVYGFLLVFLKALKDFQPDFIAAVFDFPAPTFRHKRFKKYKANRPPTPKELYQQIPIIKEILKTFNVSIFEKQGFEADDIIGTLAHLASMRQIAGEETIILSGDSDTFQLINTQTRVYALRKGVKDIVLYDEEMIREKFQGLKPEQLIDFKALKGDPSDNIPGVIGIGEKTATELILKFDNLENLYRIILENPGKVSIKSRIQGILLKYKKQAFLSKELVEIRKDVFVDLKLEDCQWRGYNKKKAIKIFQKLGFSSLIKRLDIDVCKKSYK